LRSCREALRILTNSYGHPWTTDGFGTSWSKTGAGSPRRVAFYSRCTSAIGRNLADVVAATNVRFAPTLDLPPSALLTHLGHSASHRADQAVRCRCRATSRAVEIGVVSLQRGIPHPRPQVFPPTVRLYSSNANRLLRGLGGATPGGWHARHRYSWRHDHGWHRQGRI
jgi:hypothetical protein